MKYLTKGLQLPIFLVALCLIFLGCKETANEPSLSGNEEVNIQQLAHYLGGVNGTEEEDFLYFSKFETLNEKEMKELHPLLVQEISITDENNGLPAMNVEEKQTAIDSLNSLVDLSMNHYGIPYNQINANQMSDMLNMYRTSRSTSSDCPYLGNLPLRGKKYTGNNVINCSRVEFASSGSEPGDCDYQLLFPDYWRDENVGIKITNNWFRYRISLAIPYSDYNSQVYDDGVLGLIVGFWSANLASLGVNTKGKLQQYYQVEKP